MFSGIDYSTVYDAGEKVRYFGHRTIDFLFENPLVAIITALALLIIFNAKIWVLLSAVILFKAIELTVSALSHHMPSPAS